MHPFTLNADFLAWNLREAQNKLEDPIKRIIQRALAASCSIYVRSSEGEWSGSGAHIGNGVIVTASHVAPPDLMKSPGEIAVTFDGSTLYPATVLVSEPRYDCALLSCPAATRVAGTVILADSDTAEIGDIIAVIGAPEGWHDTATVGRVSNIHQGLGQSAPSPAWNDLIFIDADILQGVSGGMVIGTDGLVIGIVIGVTGQHADVGVGENAVCPSNKIRALYSSFSS